MAYTLGSLFAGIGGIDLGFERAGFKTIWQVEIDSYCRRVLAKHFPDAERFEDVRTVGIGSLKPVDVIAGGFPCQDISNAGRQEGITGKRSGLWKEFSRIISELRPKYVLVENVAALLGRGIDVVLGDLSSLGYDAEWQIISAADVGAPHLRERVWILAYPGREGVYQRGRNSDAYEEMQDIRRIAGNVLSGEQKISGEILAGSNCPQCEGDERAQRISTEYPHISRPGRWEPEPNVGRVANGVPSRMDRLRCCGNAVVPQIPELIARKISDLLDSERPAA